MADTKKEKYQSKVRHSSKETSGNQPRKNTKLTMIISILQLNKKVTLLIFKTIPSLI